MCWNVQEVDGNFSVDSVSRLSLPPSKHRWLSAVAVLPYFNSNSAVNAATPHSQTAIICGDRKGSVHVYHCVLQDTRVNGLPTYQEPVQTLRLHGANGVTSILVHGPYIYTAGRDGVCRKFSFGTDGLLTELSKLKVQFRVLIPRSSKWPGVNEATVLIIVFMSSSQ